MTEPKDVSIHKIIFVLASGAGISQIGNMVYLVTVNVFVFEVTHCALAVSGLWMVSKIAALIVGGTMGGQFNGSAAFASPTGNFGNISCRIYRTPAILSSCLHNISGFVHVRQCLDVL